MNIFLCLILLTSLAYADSTREDIVNQQLDCFSQQLPTTISWDDICYLEDNQLAIANQELNEFEVRYAQHQQSAAVTADQDSAPYASMTDFDFSKKQQMGKRKTHTFDVAVEPYLYEYNEPTVDVELKGTMIGYHLNYAFRPADDNPLNNQWLNTYMLEGRIATGDLDYRGSGVDKGIPNENIELRALLAKDYLMADQSLITGYMGFGYRYLFDDGGGRITDTGHYGYDRHSTYWYLPIGVTALMVNKNGWSSSFNLEVDFLLKGQQVSDLSDVNQFTVFDFPDVENSQNTGYGLRGSLKLYYETQRLRFYLEPFVRYWNISNSKYANITVNNVSLYVREPKNTTLEFGSKFGLLF